MVVATSEHRAALPASYWVNEGPPERVAIVRALPGLGDLLCAVPAWRALRTALPNAHITLIGLPATEHLVARFRSYIDTFVPLPGFPGLAEQPPDVAQLPAFFARMQAQRFDLALQLHGTGGVTNILAALLGARHTAGWYLPPNPCPDPARFVVYPQHEHSTLR